MSILSRCNHFSAPYSVSRQTLNSFTPSITSTNDIYFGNDPAPNTDVEKADKKLAEKAADWWAKVLVLRTKNVPSEIIERFKEVVSSSVLEELEFARQSKVSSSLLWHTGTDDRGRALGYLIGAIEYAFQDEDIKQFIRQEPIEVRNEVGPAHKDYVNADDIIYARNELGTLFPAYIEMSIVGGRDIDPQIILKDDPFKDNKIIFSLEGDLKDAFQKSLPH